MRFDLFGDAYVESLDLLLRTGSRVPGVVDQLSIGSGFGRQDRPTVELVGVQLTLENPRACIVASDIRTVNLPYCFAQVVWSLQGSGDLGSIAYYNPNAYRFTDDGTTLPNSLATRLREHSQLERAIDRLIKDPATRR